MKILLDMNLSPSLCDLFGRDGYESVHWSQVGSPLATDAEILAWALERGYIVLTHDLDFGAILAVMGLRSPSVVQVRIHDVSPSKIYDYLVGALRSHTDMLARGALMVIDEHRTRVRILPLR